MKILSIITKSNPNSGGPIQGIRNLNKQLFKENITMNLVTLEEPNEIQLWDFSDGLKVFGLGKYYTSLAYNPKLMSFLKKNILKYNYIIIHGLWNYHSFCTVRAHRWLKKNNPELILPKLYIMPHGMLDPWFQKEKTRRLKSIRNSVYWHLIEKGVVNYADGLLFTCEEELLLARTTFRGYIPQKELLVGYGIPTPPEYNSTFADAFENSCTGINGKQFILFISRIAFKKGVDLLIDSYDHLSKQNTDLPYLVIAGPKDSDYAINMIFKAKNNPKILFPGMLTGDSKWGAFYGCEAFILPSHQENFGIAVVEALACKKPVLITDKVNIYREIEKGGAGFINKDNLDGTISNLFKWFTLSLEEKKKMSEAAYQVFQKYFTVEISAKNFYKNISKK